MKLPKTKLFEACETGKDARPCLTGVHVNPDKARLEATDGVILAVIPIPKEDAEAIGDTIIPGHVVKEASKLARRNGDVAFVNITEAGYQTGALRPGEVLGEQVQGPTYPIENLGESYPDCDQIIPDPKNYEFVAAIDVNNLLRLSRALCENGTRRPNLFVKLYQDKVKVGSPLKVVPLSTEHKDRLGLIMPLHVRE